MKRPPSFAGFSSELDTLYQPPLRAPSTRRQVRQVLREIEPHARSVRGLAPPAVAAWIAARPERSAVTARSHLRCLRSICSYALAAGYLDRSPFDWRPVSAWVRQPKARLRPPRHLTAVEVSRVLQVATDESASSWRAARLQALVYALAYLGLRAGEALHLGLADLDLDRSTVVIRSKPTWRPKTASSEAWLPLAVPLAAVLGPWSRRTGSDWLFPGARLVGPWTGGGPGSKPLDEIRALGDRAGVTGLTLAAFRKTLGTLAKGWGMGQLELKALLRHSQVETQLWYDESDVDVLRPAVSRILFA